MLSKSQSCDRGIHHNRTASSTHQPLQKTIKKPQSYLAKKFQQLYDEDRKLRDRKKAKIDQIQKKKQQSEVQGCTFKPEINNNPEYYTSNDSFLKREETWKKNIDRKIQEKRQQQEKKVTESYSFQPKISEFTLTNSHLNQTTSSNNYSKKPNVHEKKSYKTLHSQRKKFKQIAKATIVQPFKHRRIQSNVQMNIQDFHTQKQINNAKNNSIKFQNPAQIKKQVSDKKQSKQTHTKKYQQQSEQKNDKQASNHIKQAQNQQQLNNKTTNEQNTYQQQPKNQPVDQPNEHGNANENNQAQGQEGQQGESF